MTDGAALLQAILADPDDDTPRLAYADWLEEQGTDPARAEFIRLQIEFARREARGDASRWELTQRQQYLLAGYERAWTAELRPLLGRSWVFRRGFVEGVRMTAAQLLSRARALFSRTPVREVNLVNVDGRAARLARLPCLARLRALALYQLAPGDLAALASSPHLTGLTLLNLGGNWQLTPDDVQSLGSSPYMGRLDTLVINNIHGFGPPLVRALAEAPPPALRSLDLGCCDLGEEEAAALAGSTPLATLAELKLAYNALGPLGAWALAASPRLAGLTALDLSANKIGTTGARALAGSPHLAGLTSLTLIRNGIGDEGARALASSPSLARLERLFLAENALTDEGARALADSPHLGALAWLNLGAGNSISAAGVQRLRDRFGKESVL
jgi:uncharacterized protein (TIGR02996 family)